jgi:hypothetical protein
VTSLDSAPLLAAGLPSAVGEWNDQVSSAATTTPLAPICYLRPAERPRPCWPLHEFLAQKLKHTVVIACSADLWIGIPGSQALVVPRNDGYSNLMPARLMTSPHFFESDAIVAANSSGVPPAGSSPMLAKRALKAAD